eukprot:Awhi_evm1s10897
MILIIIIISAKTERELLEEENDMEYKIRCMSERQRRTYYRKLERGDFDEHGNDTNKDGNDDSEDSGNDNDDDDDSNDNNEEQKKEGTAENSISKESKIGKAIETPIKSSEKSSPEENDVDTEAMAQLKLTEKKVEDA